MSAPAAGIGGAAAGFLGRHALRAVNGWVAGGAAWLLHRAAHAVAVTSRPELGAAWFAGHYRTMVALGAAVVVPLLSVSVIQGIVRQDAGHLMRVALVQLPVALLLGATAVELVRLASAAVDAMSATVATGAGPGVSRFLGGLGALARPSSVVVTAPVPLFVTFLALMLLALGAFLLWLELVVRSAAIEVTVLFLPLVLAGMVWPVTARWSRRLGETLAALVLAKLVIVAVLALAAGAVTAGGRPGGVARVVEGTAMLLLAVASPMALLRLVPAIEAGAVGHLEGTGRSLAARATSLVAPRALRQLGPTALGGAGAAEEALVAGGEGGASPGLPWARSVAGWSLPGGLGEEAAGDEASGPWPTSGGGPAPDEPPAGPSSGDGPEAGSPRGPLASGAVAEGDDDADGAERGVDG
ncbi:MAG TPA: hypothetical protein VE152_00090 [Acidimicrobiales bacterium]|nr:hypothetical protein [Acidimicrobiales bacterium]